MAIQKIAVGNRDTWLKLREKDVTASVAAALFGEHPWVSHFELWQLKAGKTKEDPEESPAMQRGRLLEPVAVSLMREKRPDWAIKHNSGRSQVYWRDAKHRIGATPDVLIDDDGRSGIVQIKSVDQFAFREKWLVGGKFSNPKSWEVEPPLYVIIQAMVEAALVGAEVAYVAPLVVMHGLEMPIVEVPRHDGVWERLVEEVADFWASIEAGEEPAPDYKKDAALLSEMGRGDNGKTIDLTGDNRIQELLDQRERGKTLIKQGEALVDEVEPDIIAKIGDYEAAIVPGWAKVRRPTVSRKEYTVKASTYRKLDIKRAS